MRGWEGTEHPKTPGPVETLTMKYALAVRTGSSTSRTWVMREDLVDQKFDPLLAIPMENAGE